MTEDTALIEKREELKRQLARGEYKMLLDVMLDGTSRLIQKLTPNSKPSPFGYSGVVVASVTLLISFLTSILRDEYYPPRQILFAITTAGLLLAGMVTIKKLIGIFFTNLCDNLLDAIESVADLADLQRWLAATFNIKKYLFFGLTFGILLGFCVPIFIVGIGGSFPGFGPIIWFMIFNFFIGMFFYLISLFLSLPTRLGRYQFKLYAADPSSSEIIDHLSDMLNYSVFSMAVLVAIGTLILAVLELLDLVNIITLGLFFWVPLTAFFVTSQIALAKIITRAKWKTLNEIQAKIERLRSQEDIPGEKTLAHLGKLMDYHDRIKATPNSALNLRAGLSFLNSLLLPLIAFLLANIDKVIGFFAK